MNGRLRGDEVVVGGDARQRYFDARGYGRPSDGNEIALSRVEAAHLLFRGDLDTVDGMQFREFVADSAGDRFAARFAVYSDLRERGFYLSPDRSNWVPDSRQDTDFVVYPRGSGPGDGEVRYRIRAVDERDAVSAADLGDEVLAVVDEETEVTYFELNAMTLDGDTTYDLPERVTVDLLDDRVLAWDAPDTLYERGFFGTPMGDNDPNSTTPNPLQLSLVEAAYLAAQGALDIDSETIHERGRAAEGDRFDRRYRVYEALRNRDIVPRTGFKFGADFRTYASVDSVDDLGHSELLVRALPADHTFTAQDISLDVRLAHGVRKRMVFARPNPNDRTDLTWLSAGRLTP